MLSKKLAPNVKKTVKPASKKAATSSGIKYKDDAIVITKKLIKVTDTSKAPKKSKSVMKTNKMSKVTLESNNKKLKNDVKVTKPKVLLLTEKNLDKLNIQKQTPKSNNLLKGSVKKSKNITSKNVHDAKRTKSKVNSKVSKKNIKLTKKKKQIKKKKQVILTEDEKKKMLRKKRNWEGNSDDEGIHLCISVCIVLLL